MALTLHLNRFDDFPASRGLEDAARRAVRRTLTAAGQEDPGAELSVTCVDRDEIRDLNRRYLERDAATDVIAFRLDGEEAGAGGGPDLVGDVYLSPEVAARAAREHGLPPGEEVLRLIVHGVLHVLGYDHPEAGREDSEMFRLQEDVVRELRRGEGGS